MGLRQKKRYGVCLIYAENEAPVNAYRMELLQGGCCAARQVWRSSTGCARPGLLWEMHPVPESVGDELFLELGVRGVLGTVLSERALCICEVQEQSW